MIPRATYRLQFHAGFTFADAAPLAPYLAGLGISHVYASPITTARAGSMHGYDVIDPAQVNPELGGEGGFRAMVAALRKAGLGVMLDIVPNHMAVGGDDNRFWLDLLEKGEASDYAQFFDIDWRPVDATLQGKVLAPFLGASYADALAQGDVGLKYDEAEDRLFAIAYGTHCFPIRREDYEETIAGDPNSLPRRFDPNTEQGRARLHALLERQNFRLAWWKTAGDEINWRRFFDITELAGVRVERPEVFEIVHGLVFRLYAEGLIDGVRVDHVDGLADPAAYCRTLRRRLSEIEPQRPTDGSPGPAYFVVEKILARGEALSPDWLTDGTTGYDYMNQVAALLHDEAGAAPLGKAWAGVSDRSAKFESEERCARGEILERSFGGQLEGAVRAFHRLAQSDLSTRDLTAGAIRRALMALLGMFPAYRTYGIGVSAPISDAEILARAIGAAEPLAAPGEALVLHRIADWLQAKGPGDSDLKREAARRFQQLSAPVSAKAVEDTAFYRYGRLLSRNDVGSDASRLAASVEDAHAENLERAARFPHAMLTTATHDHKRGEDVRARLAVLSEIPQIWIEHAERWSALNSELGLDVDPGEEYMLYQTLVGAWPLDLATDHVEGLAEFETRVAGWQEKALREGKLRSSWAEPNEGYEQTCRAFLKAVLNPTQSGDFLQSLRRFVDLIAPVGAMNGLVQTALRCTAPGMPDLYQGCEFWDFSLVDPDNRRPVDFIARQAILAETTASAAAAKWRDGRIKQALIVEALALRRDMPQVFTGGEYEALEVTGGRAMHVMAFLRRSGADAVMVAVPLRCAEPLLGGDRIAPPATWWEDTAVRLPASFKPAGGFAIADLFHETPFAFRRLTR